MSTTPIALDAIRIASPCRASWDRMDGNDRVRFCSECRKNVYNLSAMPRAEAEALVNREESMCVRFFRRSDGTVLNGDCPVGLKRWRRRLAAGLLAAGAAMVLLAFLGLSLLFVRNNRPDANGTLLQKVWFKLSPDRCDKGLVMGMPQLATNDSP
jgi:hypothetical protein